MKLESLPKFYSPKSPKLNDETPDTGGTSLTITDVMAAQAMASVQARFGFNLFLAKMGIQDPEPAIEQLTSYAMTLKNPVMSKLSESSRLPTTLVKDRVIRLVPNMTNYQWYSGYAEVINILVTKCWQEETYAEMQLRKMTKE